MAARKKRPTLQIAEELVEYFLGMREQKDLLQRFAPFQYPTHEEWFLPALKRALANGVIRVTDGPVRPPNVSGLQHAQQILEVLKTQERRKRA